MAKIASSTSAPAGVKAPAHPVAERRAAAAPLEGAPTRRETRRRFFAEASATIAAGLGVTAAVLAPDPTWGEAEPPGAGTLPTPDAALLAAIARGTEIYDRAHVAQAEGWGSYRSWILDNCHEVVPLDEFIFSTQAVTREGCMAKAAYALKGYKPPEGEGRIGSYHFPYSALHDLYRMTGGTA